MSIYFNIIGIRKYVIKRLYITCEHNSMGLVSAMTVFTKTKAPEARD